MARKIRWTKKAENKFSGILSYLNEKFGHSSADEFIQPVYAFLHILEDFPQSGTSEDKEKEPFT